MTKLFTYLGELVVKNIDRVTKDYCYFMKVKNGWIGAKKNRRGTYNIYYYKGFPKKSYKKHNYLRNLNEN
jgi:hypothetical protein